MVCNYIHTARQGETFDTLALRLYGNMKYAAELMLCNGDYADRARFVGGEVIYLPTIAMTEDGDRVSESAPWRA